MKNKNFFVTAAAGLALTGTVFATGRLSSQTENQKLVDDLVLTTVLKTPEDNAVASRILGRIAGNPEATEKLLKVLWSWDGEDRPQQMLSNAVLIAQNQRVIELLERIESRLPPKPTTGAKGKR